MSVFSLAQSKLLPRLDGDHNAIADLWDRMSPLPGGTFAFSRLIGMMAPYTGSIRAHIREVERGRSLVVMRDRPAVRNHLMSVHAIALANVAELAGNIALLYCLPDDARLIVASIHVDYLKKARGDITARATCPVPESSARANYTVDVVMTDPSGATVATARLDSLVGKKR